MYEKKVACEDGLQKKKGNRNGRPSNNLKMLQELFYENLLGDFRLTILKGKQINARTKI